MTPEERRRILRVAEGLQTALAFVSREMLDTGVRLSIAELREIARQPDDPITAAVEDELRPLADALTDIGHKLAKDSGEKESA
jgi:hypothetical protein